MGNDKDQFTFDERRKVLKRVIVKSDNVKHGDKIIGTYTERNEQEYDLDGIKYLVGELKNQEDQIQKFLASQNRTIDATQHLGAFTEDEEHLKKMLIALQEKERYMKAVADRDNMLPNLRETQAQRASIIEALGTFRHLIE